MRCRRCFLVYGVVVFGVWSGLQWNTVDHGMLLVQPEQPAHAIENESERCQYTTQTKNKNH